MADMFTEATEYRILLRNSVYPKDINILLNLIESCGLFDATSIIFNSSQIRIEIKLRKNSVTEEIICKSYYDKIGVCMALFINNETVEADFISWANTQPNTLELIEKYNKLKNFNIYNLLYNNIHLLNNIIFINL